MNSTASRPPQPAVDAVLVRAVGLLVWGLLVGGVVGGGPAAAQTTDEDEEPGLIERYREARYRILARRHLPRGEHLPAYPPALLATPVDSLRPAPAPGETATTERPTFPLHDVRSVLHLERDWFRDRFADTEWAFLGETPYHAFLDTTRTPDLRARLQAQFGNPTQTLADRPLEKPPERQTQFEYWFVVNDSIPVQVMDVMGPKGRGLILTADRSYRSQLRALRDTLLAPLRRSERAPYVDYYYDPRRERWYRTGFDGDTFFVEQISGTDVVPGRRPRLDTVRTSDSAAPSDESSP